MGWESKREKYWLDILENRSYTTLFVDGNHENFDRLHSYPQKEWNGGKVHEIRPTVLHPMRGQVFFVIPFRMGRIVLHIPCNIQPAI